MKNPFSPVGLAVIGCGKITELVHIRNLARIKRARVVALADPDPAAAQRVRVFAPDAAIYSHPTGALDIPGVDAALICVPTALHAVTAGEALLRGKHVYLEKPLAVDLNEANDLLRAAASAGRVAMVGFNFRFNPLFLKLKRLIESRDTGKIAAVRTVFSSSAARPVPEWKQKTATGGGVLLDLASHHFDLVPFIFGSRIRDISARIWSQTYEEDNAFVQWQLENGVQIESFFSMNSVDEDRLEIYTEKGKFAADHFRPPGLLQKISRSGYEPSYRKALEVFLECASLDRPASPSFKDGYEALLAVRAAVWSHEQNAPAVMKDLRREDFAHQ